MWIVKLIWHEFLYPFTRRAVAKYLQIMFDKEAERNQNVLPIDNLLVGKSRKEASRMFFETLVSHVTQLENFIPVIESV